MIATAAPASSLTDDRATKEFAAERRAMVDCQLRTSDVTEAGVVAAMGRVAREAFLPPEQRAMAYIDRAIPLGAGRAMNAPLTTGRLLVAADLTRGDHVLLIGAARGYTAAVLGVMGMRVTAVEDDADMAAAARAALAEFSGADGGAVTVIEGPLTDGAPDHAPFDAAIIDGAVARVPANLAAQIKPNGVLVCGLVDGAVTRLARGIQVAGAVVPVPFADVGCVILPQFIPSPQFQF